MTDENAHDFAPEVLALVRRACALAARDGMPRLDLSHLLEAVFFRPVTPSLVQHLLAAAAIAQDTDSPAVGDLHVLLAVAEDGNSLVNHLLSPVMDHEAVASVLRDQLRDPEPSQPEPPFLLDSPTIAGGSRGKNGAGAAVTQKP